MVDSNVISSICAQSVLYVTSFPFPLKTTHVPAIFVYLVTTHIRLHYYPLSRIDWHSRRAQREVASGCTRSFFFFSRPFIRQFVWPAFRFRIELIPPIFYPWFTINAIIEGQGGAQVT